MPAGREQVERLEVIIIGFDALRNAADLSTA